MTFNPLQVLTNAAADFVNAGDWASWRFSDAAYSVSIIIAEQCFEL